MELSDRYKAQETFESSRAVAQHEFLINSSDRAFSAAPPQKAEYLLLSPSELLQYHIFQVQTSHRAQKTYSSFLIHVFCWIFLP